MQERYKPEQIKRLFENAVEIRTKSLSNLSQSFAMVKTNDRKGYVKVSYGTLDKFNSDVQNGAVGATSNVKVSEKTKDLVEKTFKAIEDGKSYGGSYRQTTIKVKAPAAVI